MSCESCEEKARMKEIINSFVEKNEHFQKQYDIITKFSKQAKSCIDDLLASGLEMRQNYVECTKLDMIVDKDELLVHLKKIIDLANTQTVNINVLIETIKTILNQFQGYS
jgi:hypothetical protein